MTGVPLPIEAQIFSSAGLCLVDGDSGMALDADLVPSARWGGAPDDPSRPIKWLLAAFRYSLAPGATGLVYLVDYRPPNPASAITLTQGTSVWTVDTGPVQFEIQTSGFDLFHRVTIQGVEVVSPSPGAGPYYLLDGSTHLAQNAGGGCQVSVFRSGLLRQTLTLKIKGAHRTFSPGDAIGSNDEDLDFNTFMTFQAGSGRVKVQHTIQNNRAWVAMENNADFRNVGSPNSVYADEIGLAMQVTSNAASAWTIGTAATTNGLMAGPLDAPVSIYQDSSGDASWNLWRNARQTGSGWIELPVFGPAAYVSFQGFQIHRGESLAAQGARMSGFLDISGSAGGVSVAIADFWQNFPKALRADAGGLIRMALFPADFRARHSLRVGEQKTHTLYFNFHGPSDSHSLAEAASLAHPLVALADPSWYSDACRVVPAVSMTASDQYRFAPLTPAEADNCGLSVTVTPAEHDRFMRRHLYGPGVNSFCSTNPGQNDYSFNGIEEAMTASQMFSWMDYGDLPIDFEQEVPCSAAPKSVTGQYGWKYDGDYGLWIQALRSWENDPAGDGRNARLDFFRRALAATRHTCDIDLLHHGRQSGRGIRDFRDGGAMGHSQHNDDGIYNPHRNGVTNNPCGGGNWNGTPTADILFGLPGLATAYYVTGDPPLWEAGMDLAEWARFWVHRYGTSESNTRAAANLLTVMNWSWQLTGDAEFLALGKALVSNSPAFSNPVGDLFQNAMCGEALGSFIHSLRMIFDNSLDSYLTAMTSAACAPKQNAWDFLRADAYAWGAMLLPTGRTNLLRKAETCFKSAVFNPAFPSAGRGILWVWQIKEWMNSLRMGHVMGMAQYVALGGMPFIPNEPLVPPTNGAQFQNTPPSAVLSGNGATGGLAYADLVFDASGSSDADTPPSLLSHFWNFGDGCMATGMVVTHAYRESGAYRLGLWVSDGEGVGATTSLVTILPAEIADPEPPKITAQPQSTTVTVGQAVSLLVGATGSPPLSYLWFEGEPGGESALVFTGGDSFTTPILTRDSTFWVRITNAVGAVDSEAARIAVVSAPSNEIKLVETELCEGMNGYAGTADAYLFLNFAWANFGGATTFRVYRSDWETIARVHSLVRFELPEDLRGALVEKAQLCLTVAECAGEADKIQAHRVTTSWVEGNQSGADPQSNGCTWSTRDGIEPWLSGGGADFVSSGSPETPVPEPGARMTVDVTSIVHEWAGGVSNFGWVLYAAATPVAYDATFYSSESSPAGRRPSLRLRYVTGAPPFAGPDTNPPAVEILSPAESAVVAGTTTVSARAFDDRDLGAARLWVGGSTTSAWHSLSGTNTTFALPWNTWKTGDGWRVLRVELMDAASNQAWSAPVQVLVSNDASAGGFVRTIRIGDCATCATGGLVSVRVSESSPNSTGVTEPEHILGHADGGIWLLYRFDLGAIPIGAEVRRARIRHYYSTKAGGYPWGKAVTAHPILDPDGTGPWDPTLASFVRKDSAHAWTASGGTLSGVAGTALLSRCYEPWTYSIMDTLTADEWDITSLARQWMSAPDSNLGLAVCGVQADWGSAGALLSSSFSNAAFRPFLEVEYEGDEPAPEIPAQVEQVRVTHDGVGRTFITWRESGSAEETAYRIYRHYEAIVATNLDHAERIAEVPGNGSSLAPLRTMAEGHALPCAIVDQPYAAAFSCSGSVAVTSWSAKNLPPGLGISDAGILSGTPSVTGDWWVVLLPNDTSLLGFTMELHVAADYAGSNPGNPLTIQPNIYQDLFVTLPPGSLPQRWTAREGEGELGTNEGLYVHAPAVSGAWHYAVTRAVNGHENRRDFSASNGPTAPVVEVPGDGNPVLQWGPFAETDSQTSWIFAFWPGDKFHNDSQFAVPFKVSAKTPFDPAKTQGMVFLYGGYSTTYMIPGDWNPMPYSLPSIAVSLEARTPYHDRYGGHALSDWFIGYRDNLGAVRSAPAAGMFRYYGIERSRFVARWLREGPGHARFNVDPDLFLAWGGSQGGAAILFTCLNAPDLFKVAHANVPCLNWYTEDYANLWTSGTFTYLAGRLSDAVRDPEGRPVSAALDAAARLRELVAAEPAAFPVMNIVAGWNDGVVVWDQDHLNLAAEIRSSGLPIQFAWMANGHETGSTADFGFITNRSPTVGFANCTLYSAPLPPSNALYTGENYGEGAYNGKPYGYESGRGVSHVQADTDRIVEDTNEFRVTLFAGPPYDDSVTGAVDLVVRGARHFRPPLGAIVSWTNLESGQAGESFVGPSGLWRVPGFKFRKAGNTLVARVANRATTYAAWLAGRFTLEELGIASISGEAADPDGDEAANLLEYALNRDPRRAEFDSPWALVPGLVPGLGWQPCLRFSRRKEPADVAYGVLLSRDLDAWTNGNAAIAPVDARDDGNGQTETVRWRMALEPPAEAPVFIRLGVSRP